MPASYTSGQPYHPRRHPTCWASSQKSYTVSSTPWHEAWASTPLSTHLSVQCKCTAPQIKTPSCRLTAAQQLISSSDNNNVGYSRLRAAHGADHQWNAEWEDNPTRPRIFISDTGTQTPEWPSQEQPGSGLTASSQVSDVSAPACTNEVCPPLRPVSVAQKDKPSTMLSTNVQYIDLLMDCMAWRFWMMRQFSGCSTPAPRSSAAKQWFEELAQTKKTLNDKVYNNVDVGVVENLCDVVIGQDFQRQHPRVVFEYGGPKQDFILSSASKQTCAVAAANTRCPSRFVNSTADGRPTALQSWRYSAPDLEFYQAKVKRLYEAGIIRSSNSAWRAQPLVVTNSETGKKRLRIDFAQTINLFAVLDAYPLPRIERCKN